MNPYEKSWAIALAVIFILLCSIAVLCSAEEDHGFRGYYTHYPDTTPHDTRVPATLHQLPPRHMITIYEQPVYYVIIQGDKINGKKPLEIGTDDLPSRAWRR